MKKWKTGIVAVLIGTGAFWAGCGGEAPEAAPGGEGSSAAAGAEAARLTTADFSVDGMTCGGCAIATEMSVRKLEGVASVDASYDEDADEGRCTVEYDPSLVDTEAIAEAIRGAGFEPTLRTGSSDG